MEIVSVASGSGNRIKKLVTVAVAVVAAGVALYNWIGVRELKKIAERCRVARIEEIEESQRLKKQRAELEAKLRSGGGSDADEELVEVGTVRMRLSDAMSQLTASESEVMSRVAQMERGLTSLRNEIHENYMKRNRYKKLTRSIRTCSGSDE